MSGIAFTLRASGHMPGAVLHADAVLPGGKFLTVSASGFHHEVQIGLAVGGLNCGMSFSPAQARDLAAQMLTCADALDAAQGSA